MVELNMKKMKMWKIRINYIEKKDKAVMIHVYI